MGTVAPIPNPKELRPLLHAELDRLPDEELALAHRVLMQIEMDHVTQQLDEAFDRDRAEGKLERLPEIIREARAALRDRAGR